MPLQETPRFNSTPMSVLEVENPCMSGINLADLEYEQEINQSPYVLNMMYRNGAFSKRYGQSYMNLTKDGEPFSFTDKIWDVAYYKSKLIVHSGTKVYSIDDGVVTELSDVTINNSKGTFISYNRFLYYLMPSQDGFDGKFYQYDGTDFEEVEPYVPDLVINRKPDGSQSDTFDDYNLLGNAWKNTFHADGTSTKYVLTGYNCDDTQPKVEIDGEEVTSGWTYDKGTDTERASVTFTTPPVAGTNNVVITAYKTESGYAQKIYDNKYFAIFGGDNNSRLFLAGGGKSIYYYSDVFDASYFPETNYATLGNSEDDITGFGEQYNVLIVFKPTEMYSLSYYVQSEATTQQEDEYGLGAFTSQLVNSKIGCDAPYSIQLINNQLVWYSSREGVCTLVSTNIIDERNVRPISRNINKTRAIGQRVTRGILDFDVDLNDIQSVNFDNKYFLTLGGNSYVWDYGIAPYVNTGRVENDATRLCWFVFDNFYVNKYFRISNTLYYIGANHGTTTFDNKLIEIDMSFNDFDEAITSYYMTPLFQFYVGKNLAVEYLKNVVNVYVQCRADTASVINMKYITDENPNGEVEPEPIIIGAKLWPQFDWDTFSWLIVNFGNTFRRKCGLKKIQMAGILFSNNEVDRDMSISHLAFQYQIVKNIK